MQVTCSKLPFFLLLFRGTSLPAESPKGFPGCQASTWVQYPSGWPGKLDYGIYWFGPKNSWTKAVPGNPGRFYDPSKSVLLYFHGWEGGGGGSIPVCYRQTADYSNLDPRSCSQEIRFVDEWLKSGWNVGFFYWDQFSDEGCARDAEEKVWASEGSWGLRWRSNLSSPTLLSNHHSHHLGGYHMFEGASSVTDLCAHSIEIGMPQFFGQNVRFVGHNFGAQLALRCADLLHKQSHQAAPRRIALLEPFFTLRRARKDSSVDAKEKEDKAKAKGKGHWEWVPDDAEQIDSLVPDSPDGSEILDRRKTPIAPAIVALRCEQLGLSHDGQRFRQSRARQSARLALRLWKRYRVPIEVHKTSDLTESGQLGRPNPELMSVAAVVVRDPLWCKPHDWHCRHMAAVPLYLMGFGMPSPRNVVRNSSSATSVVVDDYVAGDAMAVSSEGPAVAETVCPTPSASCSDEALAQLVEEQMVSRRMKQQQRWIQVAGGETLTAADDIFMREVIPMEVENVGDKDDLAKVAPLAMPLLATMMLLSGAYKAVMEARRRCAVCRTAAPNCGIVQVPASRLVRIDDEQRALLDPSKDLRCVPRLDVVSTCDLSPTCHFSSPIFSVQT